MCGRDLGRGFTDEERLLSRNPEERYGHTHDDFFISKSESISLPELHYSDVESFQVLKDRLISDPMDIRSHVVILGAGASVAAFPQGDANGRILPTMRNLINVVGLRPKFKNLEIDIKNKDFEEIYSCLYEKNSDSSILHDIEDSVREYFQMLKLPEEPTLYDHLLLSLRPKDIIATFNWDPFLFDAWERNTDEFPMPQIVHLHGNVRLSYCKEHKLFGREGTYCPHCGKEFTPSRLMYPVTQKNYSLDEFIKSEWDVLESGMSQAFTFTIFGYSAPTTDKEAIDLLKRAWMKVRSRTIETIEIINKEDKYESMDKWAGFTPTFHCLHSACFYESIIGKFPRRSCEAMYIPSVLGKIAEPFPLSQSSTSKELVSWLKPLIDAEQLIVR